MGKTPLKWHVDEGKHLIKVNADEYYDNFVTVDVASGKANEINLTLEQHPLVTITSKPMEAEIYVDKRKIGKTPASIRLPEGMHDLSLEKDSYQKKITMFSVKNGKDNELYEELIRDSGVVNISSNVNGASVFVDNKIKGKIPLNIQSFPTGKYDIEVKAEGYFSETQSLEIKMNQLKNLDFQLTSIESIDGRIRKYKRAKYIWLGTAIAGASAGFLLNSSADKSYDDYLAATSSSEAEDFYQKYEDGKKLAMIGFVAGGACILPAVINHFKAKSVYNKWYKERKQQRESIALNNGK